MAFENINQRIIKPLAVGENGGHELGGIITFEPGGLISFYTISGAMRFAKGIAAKTGDQIPNLGNFSFGASTFAGAISKLGLDFPNNGRFFFAQGASKKRPLLGKSKPSLLIA